MLNIAPLPSLAKCILVGSLGFCAVSLLVFGTVAFGERWMYAHLGLPVSYAVWTLLFVLCGALVFNYLVVGALRGALFCLLFAAAFVAYAAGWCGAYFLLRGALGEWIGALLGSALMAVVFAAGFKQLNEIFRFSLLLFVANAIGYFLGSFLNTTIGGQAGMILWGVSYGLFFGAAIGALLHFAQREK